MKRPCWVILHLRHYIYVVFHNGLSRQFRKSVKDEQAKHNELPLSKIHKIVLLLTLHFGYAAMEMFMI